ncbi:hypothetical protein Tco_0013787 [Tanacetum coccineum]
MACLCDLRTLIRAVLSSSFKFLAIMTGNLSSPSKNAYSRWDGKSLSSRSGGSSHEDLTFSGTLISQTGDGWRFVFNQSNYIKEMLKKFVLEESKPMKTPMSSDTKLTKDEELSAFVPASNRLLKPLTLKRLSVSSDTLKQFFSYSLEEFAQILDIPCEGACVFTDKWSLDKLAYGVPTDGPYQTNPTSPDDIISYIQIDREGQVRRIRHEQEIDVHDHQILTREIVPTLKPLEEIIRENVFCLGGNRDHVPACLCYMLYCVANSEKFNLAYYMAKRMDKSPYLLNESYVLYDRVMNPLTAQQEQKTRKDRGTRRGRHSTSSPSAFDQPSSSYLNDDDDENEEGTSHASTPSLTRFVNSLTNDVP